MSVLRDTLESFKDRANANPRVHALIRTWQPKIVVKANTSQQVFTMKVAAGRIADIASGDGGDDESIFVSASDDLIRGVFSGTKNPMKEYTDGRLTVLGDEADKIKLDAICLVLWGKGS